MKKLAKIIGLVVLALVVLSVGLLFFLTRMFDPNDYKEQIQQAARDKANVELTLGGEIGWSLFPWLGIELKQVGLAPVEHPEKMLAEIGSMGLGVEVLPLMRKQLRMSDVIMDDISLHLEKDENGVANWSTIGLQNETEAGDDAKADTAATAGENGESGGLDIAVQSVRITNARVSYIDRQTAQKLSLEDVNLTTGALIENEPFDVQFLGLLMTGQPAMRMRVDLKTVASFDLRNEQYQLEGFDLKLDASGDPFNGRAVGMRLQGDSLIDLQQQVAELKQLRLSMADLRATGEITARDLDSDLKLNGSINVAEFDARSLIHSLGQNLPEMAHKSALSKVALAARVNGSANSLMLEDLKLMVDGTELSGNMGLADFERQALRFALTGTNLNIDNYLPPPESKTESPAAAQAGGSTSKAAPEPWSNEAVLPMETLAGLNVIGSLDMQQVQLTGQTISPFKTAVEAVGGNVRLKQFEGGVFGGKFTASAAIDASRSPAVLSLNSRLTGMDSLALQQAYDMAQQFRGKLDLNMNLKTQGNSMLRWVNSLNGDVRFDVADGALLGVNLEQKLCQAIALVNREQLSGAHGSENTPFRQLGGSFTIVNGNINNRNLFAALPGIAVKGNGDINLPEQRLDYRLGLLLEGDKSDMPDPACQVNKRYVGIEWPIRCDGYLHNAAKSCGVDTEGVTRIAGQLLGNEAKRKVEEKLEDKLGDKAPAVRDALKGLFNR